MWTRILINCLFLNVGKASAQVVPDQYPALTAGDNLTLTCNVNEETMNVTQKKDGDSPSERAKNDTRFDDRKSKLAITEVVKEDSGVYSCEARNKLGFVALSSVKINVKGKLMLLLCLKKHKTPLIKKYISKQIETIFQLKTKQLKVT